MKDIPIEHISGTGDQRRGKRSKRSANVGKKTNECGKGCRCYACRSKGTKLR